MGVKIEEEKKICGISELMETFGKYQIIQFIMVCLPSLFITMISINYVFVVGDVDYRCHIDGCENASSTSEFPSWWPDTDIDRCSKPVLRSDVQECTNTSFTGQLATCDSWIYENNNTVVAELDLACQPWKVNLIGTIHSTGMLLSMIVSGYMSDKFGRKPTLLFCVVGGCIGQAKPFATSYTTYVIIEFLEASITAGTYPASMVVLLEIAGKKHRLLSGVVFAYAIYLGECLFACIAMFVPHWKTLVRIINGPCIFFIVFTFLINESPRWQIVSGKVDEAKKSIKRIAKLNKLRLDENELASLDEVTLKEKLNIGRHEVKENFFQLFKSKEIIKRSFVAGVCRFTSTFVYYGLMINSVWLPGDKYTNFLLATVMSFPGELLSLYLMNKIGRKIPLMVGYALSGILCILSAVTPADILWLKLTLFLLGKVIISACFTGAVTYSMELFPTSVRGSLLGICAFASRVGGMLAPLTPIMNSVSEVLPYIFFGASAILSGLLLILTPETKDLPLFDTINQVDKYVKNKTIPGTKDSKEGSKEKECKA
ncbi:organic cation transporter protein-like [Anticarsia gemmatalis]|uniref:organic cation transporter protein-like n=1 Tax=Anticarsia gemmatalis TaxID=129554 RepID=UPI003F774925